jgi:hypothetical protein
MNKGIQNSGQESGRSKGNYHESGHNQKDGKRDEIVGRQRDNNQGAFGDEGTSGDKQMKPEFVDKKKKPEFVDRKKTTNNQ